MKFWKKKEKSNESTMWRYAKRTAVVVCVIGIGVTSINVIPTGYTGVKSTFGRISEKDGPYLSQELSGSSREGSQHFLQKKEW